MRPERPLSGFKLVEITEPGILASLERIDAMSDQQTRDLALVATGAEAMQLETVLESADREATERELDTATLRHMLRGFCWIHAVPVVPEL